MKVELSRLCPMCGNTTIKELEIDKENWTHFCCYGTKLIQEYFPDLSASEREFIKTGYCDNCQKILFAAPEDEDDCECEEKDCNECNDTECIYKKYLEEKGE